jgi:hypothetical protein
VAQAGGFELQESLLGQIVQGSDQAVSLRFQGLAGRFEVEVVPHLGLPGLLEDAAQELPSFSREAAQDAYLELDGYLKAGTPLYAEYEFRPLVAFYGPT